MYIKMPMQELILHGQKLKKGGISLDFLRKTIGTGSPVDNAVTRLEHFIVMFAGFSALIIMFVNIVLRYAAHFSLVWAEEYARYCLIIIVYFGASMAVQRKSMLKVEILASIFPKLKSVEEYVEIVLGIITLVLLIIFGLQFVTFIMPFGEKSAAMNWLPMWIIYLIMPVGSVFIIFRYLQRALYVGQDKEAN